MALEVRLDKKIIFQSTFPLCRAKRSTISSPGKIKRLDFTFKPPRAIVWKGYRDRDDTTPANQLIEGNIWLAGSDPDDLLLGATFMSSSNIYMNSIHIAHPGRRDETEMAPGLVVITYPIKQSK